MGSSFGQLLAFKNSNFINNVQKALTFWRKPLEAPPDCEWLLPLWREMCFSLLFEKMENFIQNVLGNEYWRDFRRLLVGDISRIGPPLFPNRASELRQETQWGEISRFNSFIRELIRQPPFKLLPLPQGVD
ncbi:hypothetical protein CEXT_79121 [Caerostris extrusa]|uniref:Uncharacterized protein n=1 Tax=Caerostris extrusa TaxID=172846 RepID=A0AAV4NPS6_CAEEX|nr:hypothetical protein CEXT_79121 [Caerostris extrusa]